MKAIDNMTRRPLADYVDSKHGRALQRTMIERYRASNLLIDPAVFQRYVSALPQQRASAPKEKQRDLSYRYAWGHNHDFGSFRMEGLMGDRHVAVLAAFNEEHGVPGLDLADKRILDIGVWTGGTSLLLAALGAEVVAVEEVGMYAETVEYLAQCFGVESLSVVSKSLYALDDPEFFESFDLVLYSGVLYHVSDPVLSLRILFNALRVGGTVLVESMASDRDDSSLLYGQRREKSEGAPTLGGWAWFIPTLSAVSDMMTDAGFKVSSKYLHGAKRATAVGVKTERSEILRAGLARPDIP